MPEALYRKYRPQTFAEVIGQPHIKQTLLNQLKSQNIAHAYLFCGPRGIGKTTLARLLAKSVNCLETSDGEPCNKCKHCQSINAHQALDIIEIDAASNTGVDNVRDNIINNALVATSGLKHKVFIIDEVHMLSISAFNALLKTLEEPPKNVIFILATTEIHKVPATIISRCQRFDFKKVPLKEITTKLEKIVAAENVKVDLEVLEKISKNSEGCARDAESLLSQVIVLDENHVTAELAELVLPKTELNSIIDFFYLLAEKNSSEAISHINKLVSDGIDLSEFNKNLIEFLRKILLYKISGNLKELEYLDIDNKTHQNITNFSESLSVLDLKSIIEIFLSKISDLTSAQVIQLPLELAVVEICEPAEPPEIKKKIENKNFEETRHTSSLKIDAPPKFSNGHKNITPIQTTAQQNNVEKDKATLDEIKNKFPAIIKALREKNHSLALTLSIAQLVTYDKNNTLTLGVKYQFHSDRICEPENLAIIESVLESQLQRPVKVVCLVDAKYEDKKLLNKIEKSDNLDNINEEEVDNVWDLAVSAFNQEHASDNKEDNIGT